jgi:hypothetical protein
MTEQARKSKKAGLNNLAFSQLIGLPFEPIRASCNVAANNFGGYASFRKQIMLVSRLS